jgi:hypothetical protein
LHLVLTFDKFSSHNREFVPTSLFGPSLPRRRASFNAIRLIVALTWRVVAQVWCDHSGWDASRQYGTSIKAWTFDVVGILKAPPEEQRQPGVLTFNLSFEPPNGKCRRRTPDNRDDFKTINLTLRNGVWTAEDAIVGRSLSDKAQEWLRDITNVFAIPGIATERQIASGDVLVVRLVVSRDQLREGLKRCGRIGDDSHAALTQKDRSLLRDWLNRLRQAGKLELMVTIFGSRENATRTDSHANPHATSDAQMNVRACVPRTRTTRTCAYAPA